MMGIISLEGLEFYSYHGFYDKERKEGNKFIVDVSLKTDLESAGVTDDLSQTIDYGEVYSIIKEEMNIPSKLLENVVLRIQNRLVERFSSIQSITISLSKMDPPIGGRCYRAKVTISKDFPV